MEIQERREKQRQAHPGALAPVSGETQSESTHACVAAEPLRKRVRLSAGRPAQRADQDASSGSEILCVLSSLLCASAVSFFEKVIPCPR